jgi:hypothetical protein
MPLVQKYQRQVGPAPLPGVRLQAAETPESEGAGVALAKAQTAQTAANLALQLGQDAVTLEQQHEKAVAEADRTAVIGAGTQLDTFHVNLHAPDGAFSQQGVNALGLPESVKGQYDELADKLAAGMTNDRQRQLFTAMRAEKLNSIMGDLLPYVSRQADAVQDDTDQRAVNAKIALGIASAGDHLKVNQSIDDAAAIVRTQAQRNGLTPEATSDALRLMQSSILEGSIKKLVADGQPTLAQQWLDESRQAIDGTKLGALDELVTNATVSQRAIAQANEILATTNSKGDALTEAAKIGDDAVASHVRQRIDEVWAARTAAATQSHAQLLLDAKNTIEKSGSFFSLTPAVRAQLTEPEDSALRGFAKTVAGGGTKETDWGAYTELDNLAKDPARRAEFLQTPIGSKYGLKLSNGQLEKFIDLQTEARNGDPNAKVLAASMDSDQFNAIAANAGLQVYGGPNVTPNDRERVGQLKNAVETEIDAQQKAKKRELTRDEKGAIAQHFVDQRVLVDAGWLSTGTALPAVSVTQADRAETPFVPIAQVPKPSVEAFANTIRANSAASLKMSTDSIASLYRDRIQRAYAAFLLKLPDAQIDAILLGKDR